MKDYILKKKQDVIAEIKTKIENSQSIVLVNYIGLNVEQVSDLRNKYREANVDYKVYKNTMMKFAFKEAGYEDFNEFLEGPNAVAFSLDDPVNPARISFDFSKTNDSLKIKAGIVDGKIISDKEVEKLAKLPSKEVLIAQVLGGLNSPIQGLANVLTGNISGLVRVLAQISEIKEQN